MHTLDKDSNISVPMPPIQASPFINLIHTYNWLSDKLRAILDGYDITTQQYNVLRILGSAHPMPLCGSELKDAMMDKNPDVTRLCDRLEAKNLIERKDNVANRRQIHVYITEAGLEMLNSVSPIMEEKMEGLLCLTEPEGHQLSALLEKMRKC